jgi:hypothetical protein
MPIIDTIAIKTNSGVVHVDIHLENNHEGEYVYYTADANIDADGANGQNGYPAAYQVNSKYQEVGSDWLSSINLKVDSLGHFSKINNGDLNVILNSQGQPRVFSEGVIASMTSLRYKNIPPDDPKAYIDAACVPYIAIPSLVIAKTQGIVLGCLAKVTWNGKSIYCVVADNSGNNVGELSSAAASELGFNGDPKSGGVDDATVLYEIWPGKAVDGFPLQSSLA